MKTEQFSHISTIENRTTKEVIEAVFDAWKEKAVELNQLPRLVFLQSIEKTDIGFQVELDVSDVLISGDINLNIIEAECMMHYIGSRLKF